MLVIVIVQNVYHLINVTVILDGQGLTVVMVSNIFNTSTLIIIGIL